MGVLVCWFYSRSKMREVAVKNHNYIVVSFDCHFPHL